MDGDMQVLVVWVLSGVSAFSHNSGPDSSLEDKVGNSLVLLKFLVYFTAVYAPLWVVSKVCCKTKVVV
jgi:hypothetical protein